MGSQSTQLPKVATHVPDGAKPESRVKRFARWVDNVHITAERSVVPYAEVMLAHLALQTLVLVIDGSVVGRGCVALMLHVVYKGRALPLASVVRRGKKGHFPEALHIALITQGQELIPPGAHIVVLGDGECDGTDLLHTLQEVNDGLAHGRYCWISRSTSGCPSALANVSSSGSLPGKPVRRACTAAARKDVAAGDGVGAVASEDEGRRDAFDLNAVGAVAGIDDDVPPAAQHVERAGHLAVCQQDRHDLPVHRHHRRAGGRCDPPTPGLWPAGEGQFSHHDGVADARRAAAIRRHRQPEKPCGT